MRGAVSAAMLNALDDYGFRDVFDVVYGVSSGAVNAAYFIAGSVWYPLSIYYDDLSSPRFIDIRRALSRRSVLDLDYAFNTVVDMVKPLDYSAVLRSPVQLVVGISDVDRRSPLLACDFASEDDLRSALRASAWLPLVIRERGEYRGRRVLDGGVLAPHPGKMALDAGNTHVLSLSTKPASAVRGGVTALDRLAAWQLDREAPGLGESFLRTVAGAGEDQTRMRGLSTSPAVDPPHLLNIAPAEGNSEVKRQEIRATAILKACRSAYAEMFCHLEGRPVADVRAGRLECIPRLSLVEKGAGGRVDLHLHSRDAGGVEVRPWRSRHH